MPLHGKRQEQPAGPAATGMQAARLGSSKGQVAALLHLPSASTVPGLGCSKPPGPAAARASQSSLLVWLNEARIKPANSAWCGWDRHWAMVVRRLPGIGGNPTESKQTRTQPSSPAAAGALLSVAAAKRVPGLGHEMASWTAWHRHWQVTGIPATAKNSREEKPKLVAWPGLPAALPWPAAPSSWAREAAGGAGCTEQHPRALLVLTQSGAQLGQDGR